MAEHLEEATLGDLKTGDIIQIDPLSPLMTVLAVLEEDQDYLRVTLPDGCSIHGAPENLVYRVTKTPARKG